MVGELVDAGGDGGGFEAEELKSSGFGFGFDDELFVVRTDQLEACKLGKLP